MSDIPIEPADPQGREPTASESSPPSAAIQPAAAGDEHAGEATDVEPIDSPANIAVGLPDHLVEHGSIEEAYAAYQERTRGYPDFGALMEAHDARRRDNSRRLEHWLNGGDQ